MERTPIVFLTRSETFSASHRLHSSLLPEEENQLLYGKCNNANGHGHNYTANIKISQLHLNAVEVTVIGKVNSVTGMVLNLSDLKQYMKEVIMDVLDHKNLDKDVAYFKNKVSTTENLSVFIWEGMNDKLPTGSLHEVKVHETSKNSVVFRGRYE